MKITLAAQVLGDDPGTPVSGVKINGEEVLDVADLVRSAAKKIFDRGNQVNTLTFSVRRTFSSVAVAQAWALAHGSMLTKSGTCVVSCGAGDGDETVVLQNAALRSWSPEYQGRCGRCTYTIVFASAETGADFSTIIPTEGDPTMIQKDQAAISSGATSVTVVFGTPFAQKPVVTAAVAKPGASGANLWATVRDDLTSATGFTADLSGPAPDADHVLNWIAMGE